MGFNMKLARKSNRFERQKVGIAVLAGCFLASVTFLVLPKPRAIPSPTLSLPLSLHAASTSFTAESTLNSKQSEEDGTQENATVKKNLRCDVKDKISGLCEQDDVVRRDENYSTNSFHSSGREEANSALQYDGKDKMEERNQDDILLPKLSSTVLDSTQNENIAASEQSELAGRENGQQEMIKTCDHQCEMVRAMSHPKNPSTTASHSAPKENTNYSTILDASSGNKNPERKPLCDVSDHRIDLCEMDGDIRIHGNSSSVTLMASSQTSSSEANDSWRIRPYARKGDDNALSHVREVFVRSKPDAPTCTHNHSVPAVVFSVGGYSGNIFHAFTDVLIPLFLTAREFDGEVQFVVSDMTLWWIHKYQLVLQKLSKYPIIEFGNDDSVHCFPRVIVGLRCHKELSIDPARSPNGYSMVDFTKFMRTSFSLERESPTRVSDQPGKKPRLLIIPRKRTRELLNVDEVSHMAEELGFEVVVMEPALNLDIGEIARVVNSCDVMMSVHGAGLTNMVYLPTNATVIQIVPWGGLEWICKLDFGDPAKDMKLNYLQYSISPEESSLKERYPRDHPVFKEPFKFHNRGWDSLRIAFMDGQNVRLDVRRFRAVLLKALEHLH